MMNFSDWEESKERSEAHGAGDDSLTVRARISSVVGELVPGA